MIRFTKDNYGEALVFPSDTKLEELQLDNCVVDRTDHSILVFPFSVFTIGKYQYSWLNTHRPNSFLMLKGQKLPVTYHYACKNKMNYVTNGTRCAFCTFTPAEDLPFKWKKSNLKFVKPIYCDIQGQCRTNMSMEYLCPDEATEKKNKETLSARGNKAVATKKLNQGKCSECIFLKTCSAKKERATKNCSISRKMLNRRMRELSIKRFGSFSNLASLMSYAGQKKNYTVVAPINQKLVLVKENSASFYHTLTATSVSKIKSSKQVSIEKAEQMAKVYMLFLTLLEHSKIEGLRDGTTVYYFGYSVKKNGARKQIYATQHLGLFDNYNKVLKIFGERGQSKLERILGGKE